MSSSTSPSKLKAAGIPALAVAESEPGFCGHVFENILVADLGPEKYRGLFDGTTGWDDRRRDQGAGDPEQGPVTTPTRTT